MNSADRRARIVDAAAELFIAHGYAGVSMEDVVTAVGGSKSTLYRYFTDKTELFRAAVEGRIGRLSEPLRSFQPGGDVTATLRKFGRYLADIVLAPEAIALHRLVQSEAERIPGPGETFLEHAPAVGNAILGRYLAELCGQGVLELEDPVLAAGQLFQAMLGGLQMRMLMNPAAPPTRKEVERSIATAVEIFLNGAKTRT
ncbi:TetR/AcrR family transcriptional regulator [Amycolatopsis acidicola]|uniref:TetR/AcrR family transcriptional regulator n=1 Tax=Amycolatopsis acidicola TaxID=2596893 RepID=UPI001AA02365|nr:TetR/AcrR family transcriptional regulator [Amycolatopsis acidicola]